MAREPHLQTSGLGASGKAPWTNPFIPQRELIGASAAMNAVKDIASSIAARRCTVMIHGETGSGKEMLARHLHQLSDRSGDPFVPVDCCSLTDTLFESELFGHVRGAFTGAIRDSLGFIRAADKGTLFMDEIGELSLPMQAKLLRVIQERIVVPVGSGKPHPVDVRIICATHRNLSDMVREGTFREDLYFRLNVVGVQMPPLRERPADILPLARHFLASQAALYDEKPRELSENAGQLLVRYPWPGNVRELANVMEHAHVLSTDIVDTGNLPERLRAAQSSLPQQGSDLLLKDIERRTITEALRRTKFSKAAAARLLGINIQKLNRRIQRLGIRVPLL